MSKATQNLIFRCLAFCLISGDRLHQERTGEEKLNDQPMSENPVTYRQDISSQTHGEVYHDNKVVDVGINQVQPVPETMISTIELKTSVLHLIQGASRWHQITHVLTRRF